MFDFTNCKSTRKTLRMNKCEDSYDYVIIPTLQCKLLRRVKE